jgi:type IV pilus assembly protein PilV
MQSNNQASILRTDTPEYAQNSECCYLPNAAQVSTFQTHSQQKIRSLSTVSSNGGVGMIEILVTLFILSVGLLGVAYLQFVGSFTNAESLSRTQSVMVAQQFSERLRANATFSVQGEGLVVDNDYFDLDLYNFENLSCPSGGLPYDCYCLTRPVTIPNCNGNACSTSQLAAFDAYEMSCAAVQSNPQIKVALRCEDNDLADGQACSVGSKHIVTLSWPVENWQNIDRTLNAKCNVDETSPHDCVAVDITL